MKLLLSILSSIIGLTALSQTGAVKRKLPATRTFQKIIIDGDLKDNAWQTAPVATKFVEFRPTFGKVEDDKNKTEVYILYDDDAIYVGGFCHEPSPDSISKELVGRDVIGVNDYVGVLFDTYNDNINGFGYYVTPLGEQYDAKYTNSGEDGSWSSVYESHSNIVPGGWTFEMRIPYSAIRFSNKKIQDWGINITRNRKKSGKQYFWNPLNPNVGGTLFSQAGVWSGIHDIKPPLRLSFSPYLAAYSNNYPYNTAGVSNWASSINGGMDVKYGINAAFTLDMTLIPDFGQVQSDNQVLNLTPFEVKYNENRTFFTEGTELFSKGNIFYSRRIGGLPLHYGDVYNEVNANETLLQNPTSSKLINATKISGRTAKGLGIGFFNAITEAQYATVEDNMGGKRSIQTSPLTNYNIIVLDQSLKNNSSISFINTSTLRNGKDYDANVSCGLWDIYNKNNKWNFFGQIAVSQLYGYLPNGNTQLGYSHKVALEKPSGRFTFTIYQHLTDDKYNQNDMGYATNNNFLDHGFSSSYKWLKPTTWYNNLRYNIDFTYSTRFYPASYQYVSINTNINGQFKNLWDGGIYFGYRAKQNDFYEPRKDGKVYKAPENYTIDAWINSNSTKKYSAGIELAYKITPFFSGSGYDINLNNNFRFNKKLTIALNNNITLRYNNVGFATTAADSIIFGSRTRSSVENIFNIKYNFNNKMGLTFRARHYWSNVAYHQFYNLNNNGTVTAIGLAYPNTNYNINFFNIDMVYTWQFALGSFINVGWKNSTQNFDSAVERDYFKNLGNTLASNQLNSFSIKVIYFLDYGNLKKRRV